MPFRISTIKNETENKTIKFPLDLIIKIEKAIEGKNVTFSRFVIEACKYVFDNLEEYIKFRLSTFFKNIYQIILQ